MFSARPRDAPIRPNPLMPTLTGAIAASFLLWVRGDPQRDSQGVGGISRGLCRRGAARSSCRGRGRGPPATRARQTGTCRAQPAPGPPWSGVGPASSPGGRAGAPASSIRPAPARAPGRLAAGDRCTTPDTQLRERGCRGTQARPTWPRGSRMAPLTGTPSSARCARSRRTRRVPLEPPKYGQGRFPPQRVPPRGGSLRPAPDGSAAGTKYRGYLPQASPPLRFVLGWGPRAPRGTTPSPPSSTLPQTPPPLRPLRDPSGFRAGFPD